VVFEENGFDERLLGFYDIAFPLSSLMRAAADDENRVRLRAGVN